MIPAEHLDHTAVTRHAANVVTYLVTGDVNNLAELEAAVSLLPLCARGRVFIAGHSEISSVDLSVPARMTVTVLKPGQGDEPSDVAGDALVRAVKAWSSEMFCDQPEGLRVVLTGDVNLSERLSYHLVSGCDADPESIAIIH